jgi:hypothetical protein
MGAGNGLTSGDKIMETIFSFLFGNPEMEAFSERYFCMSYNELTLSILLAFIIIGIILFFTG